jgi:ferredoxin
VTAVRVEVDAAVCEANGVCERLAPEVYELDDEDVLHIKVAALPAHLRDRALQAVDACPKQALTVIEG